MCRADTKYLLELYIQLNKLKVNIPNPSTYRFAVAGVLTLISLRLVMYQASTTLLPPDILLGPVLILLGYTISPLLGIVYLKTKKPFPHKIFMIIALGLLIICSVLTSGPYLLLTTWLFSVLSWTIFYSSLIYDFQRLNKHGRYFSIILMVIVDVISRYASIGTTLALKADMVSIVLQALFSIIVLYLAYSEKLSSDESSPHQMNYPLIATFTLANFILLRFSINISTTLSYYGSTSVFHYILMTFLFILFLILFTSTLITKYILSNIGWIGSLIIIGAMIILSDFGEVPPYILIFVTISIARLLVELGSNSDTGNSSIKLIGSSIFFTSLLFILFLITYYGGTNLLLLIPIIYFIYVRMPNSLTSVHQLTNNTKLIQKMILVTFFVLILLTPVIFINNQPGPVEEDQFGVMTYNVQFGINSEGEYNPDEIANYIVNSGVSVVGLQEVTRGSLLNGNGDLLLQIARILETNGFKYSVVMDNPAEIFTNVIFSKYPIVSSSQMYFSENGVYRKGIISATLDVEGNEILFAVTHLTHIYTIDGNASRMAQAYEIIDFFDYSKQIILVGDMNVEFQDTEVQIITDVFYDNWGHSDSSGYSWPAPNPNQRIDYIFTYGLNATSIITDHDALFSDHYPIIAWF